MIFEILKIVLPFLGGGLAGALVNEWLRRRHGKIQAIPLIERVNRLVNPQLKGITLARVTGAPGNRQLEEIEKLREYQLTLRNTSTVHLQDAEVQFEFPTEDVEAWVSRPALSKTAPEPVDAVVTDPWKKGFRWRIPHLPSTDSIEFSFRAVNPPSDEYEVALYKTDRVVIERSKGEPSARKTSFDSRLKEVVLVAAASLVAAAISFLLTGASHGNNVATLKEGACTLTVISSFDRVAPGEWPWSGSGPWRIFHRVINAGTQKCVVESGQLTGAPAVVLPGEELKRTAFSASKPKLVQRELGFGIDGSARKSQVALFGESQEQ